MSGSSQTILCITGMHRSGTSMITRLLNLCGMDLGAPEDMMPATPANPEGYWEHVWFTNANNAILDYFLGAWDIVPQFPPNWPDVEGLQSLREEAKQRIAAFTSPVWGWKDPRNCITMAFWRQFVPGMKVVVCLRNPLDVAASLSKRGSSSHLFSLQLWWQYTSRLLLETRAEDRIVTHFDCYFPDGKPELARVLGCAGMTASESAIAQACGASHESLRHATSSMQSLQEQCRWPELIRCYCKLLSEAGELCRERTPDWDYVEAQAREWTTRDCCNAAEWASIGPWMQPKLDAVKKAAAEQAAAFEVERKELEAFIPRCQQLERQIAMIQASPTWRALTKVRLAALKVGLVKPAPTEPPAP